MVSKELFLEIMPEYKKYKNIKIEITKNILISLDGQSVFSSVNIYEFAYLCKEWAYSKGFNIEPSIDGYVENKDLWHYNCHILEPYTKNTIFAFKEEFKTEIEAIFQACEWILKNK